MTVGEKIQFYRKNMQMSQDELGQRLNVSRQTISLWETGQTLPTIDNLILLKDVFSVSVDELLSVESPKTEETSATDENADVKIQPPVESYTFSFTPQEYAKIQKLSTKNIRFSLIASIVIFVIMLILAIVYSDDTNGWLAVLTGVSVAVMAANIKTNTLITRNMRMSAARVCSTTYQYDMYGEYFIVTLFRGGECVKSAKIYVKDIEQINDLGAYYVLVYAGQSWIIKKQELAENSVFSNIVKTAPRKKIVKTSASKWNLATVALNIFSICSIFLFFMVLSIFQVTGAEIYKYMWIAALFIPFTAASVVLGFFLKKTADKGRPNIIIGIISTSVLLVLALFSVFGPLITQNADKYIARIESYTGVDVPTYQGFNITNYAGTSGTRKVATFTFTDYATSDFEDALMLSGKWLRTVPRDIEILADYGYNADKADFFFVYNLDTGEINSLPEEGGTYNFMNVYYDIGADEMVVIEYTYSIAK